MDELKNRLLTLLNKKYVIFKKALWGMVVLALSVLTAPSAFAVCSGPIGATGTIEYFSSNSLYKYCNGTKWVVMAAPTAGSGSCSNAGEMFYDSSDKVIKFCDGAVLRTMNTIPGAGGVGCTSPTGKPGALEYQNSMYTYCDGTNWVQVPPPPTSCSQILQYGFSSGNGLYLIDPDGSGGTSPLNVYCNMTIDGGGWTMVAAQFETDPVTNWNEGTQGDYDPDLSSSKGFALSTAQLPSHNQIGFGKGLDPTYVDWAATTYTTGNIAKTTLTGLSNGSTQYHIHRNTSEFYNTHDPENTLYTSAGSPGFFPTWGNTLTFDKTGGIMRSWAFSPQNPTSNERGHAMNGGLDTSAQSYAWTVWVRNDPGTTLTFNNIETQNYNVDFFSNIVQMTGASTSIAIAGDGNRQYRICADATCSTNPSWTSSSGTINTNEYVQLKMTSPASAGSHHTATLTLGSNFASWGIGTPIKSCSDILKGGLSTGNGIYTIDPDGDGADSANIDVYCDMTMDDGGWTMIVAQFESDPVSDWNEGRQGDYDPDLSSSKSFALSTTELPPRDQIALGKHLNPTFVDWAAFSYSTGNIATTNLTGLRDGAQYQIHRSTSGFYLGHDPEATLSSSGSWNNTLTFDQIGTDAYTWAFSPWQGTANERGNTIKSVHTGPTSESYAWTVWVRDGINTFKFNSADTQTLNTLTTSNIVAYTGSTVAVSVSGSGSPEYRICADGTCSTNPAWTSTAGSVASGQYLQLRMTSPTTTDAINTAQLKIGSTTSFWRLDTYLKSCKNILDAGLSTGNDVYTIDPDGAGSGSSISAYCNMATDGGGWTMVAAQFQGDQMTNWNEGTQGDYDPDLSSTKSFALSFDQMPPHTQIGFGKDTDPTFIDWTNFKYRNGNFPKTTLTGLRNGTTQYHIYRHVAALYSDHDPESAWITGLSDWFNTLTFDKTGGAFYTWAFSPMNPTANSRSYSMNGSNLSGSSESYAWTVWIR